VSDRILVVLRPAAPLRRSDRGLPRDRSRLRLHLGTDQLEATVGRSGRESVALDDGKATAILRLGRPVAVAIGDRFVLRRSSPATTEAAGLVIDPLPPRGPARRRITPERLAALAAGPGIAALVAIHGALPRKRVDHVKAALGEEGSPPPPLELVAPDLVEQLARAATSRVDGSVRLADLRTALAVEMKRSTGLVGDDAGPPISAVLDGLFGGGRLVRDSDVVRDPRAAPEDPFRELLGAMDRLAAALEVVAPPALSNAARASGCPPEGIRELERSGRIVRLEDDLAYGIETYQMLEERAVEMARTSPLTPAAFRDATGTSRKYVMATLEDLDRRAVLRRTPAGHVPGPRAKPGRPVGTSSQ